MVQYLKMKRSGGPILRRESEKYANLKKRGELVIVLGAGTSDGGEIFATELLKV